MLLSGPVSISGNYDLSGRRITSAKASGRTIGSSGDDRSDNSDTGGLDDDSISRTSEGSANSLSTTQKRSRRHVTIDTGSSEDYRSSAANEPKTRYPPLTPLTSSDSNTKLKCEYCYLKLRDDASYYFGLCGGWLCLAALFNENTLNVQGILMKVWESLEVNYEILFTLLS